MSSRARLVDEHGNVTEHQVFDPWAFLEELERRYPPRANPARDARFEQIMRARREAREAARRSKPPPRARAHG